MDLPFLHVSSHPPSSFSLATVHMSAVHDLFASHDNENTRNEIIHEYDLGNFRGYGAIMDDE